MLLGESLEKKHFVGMGMIGLGLSLIDGRIVARLRTPQRK
jgi:hypothetical protein